MQNALELAVYFHKSMKNENFSSTKKIIKEDNVGDIKKFDLMLYKVDSLHLENCKMVSKAGSFYRIRNKEDLVGIFFLRKKSKKLKRKEQGREKYKISDSSHSQPCLGWEGTGW